MKSAMPAKFRPIEIANETLGPIPSLSPHFSALWAACSVVFARISPMPALASARDPDRVALLSRLILLRGMTLRFLALQVFRAGSRRKRRERQAPLRT